MAPVEAFINYILGQFQVIRNALPSFIVAVLGAIILVWYAMDWRYGGIIANRDSEISSLTTQRNEYRDKLSGASPDQAAQKIKSLSDEVAALKQKEGERSAKEWPALTPKQIAQWSIQLSKYKPTFLAVFFTDSYSEKFRESLSEVFREANWPTPTVLNAGYLTGIKILAAQNDPIATELFRLMDSLPMQKGYEYENPPVPGKLQIYIGKLN